MPKHLVSLAKKKKKNVNPDVWHCIDKTSRWQAELASKLLKCTRCSGFFRLQGLRALGDVKRKQMSLLDLHHLHAFPGHWSGCVTRGFKLKMSTTTLEKSSEKYKKDVMWYLSKIHGLGSHWVTSILRPCGYISKYSPPRRLSLSTQVLGLPLSQKRVQLCFCFVLLFFTGRGYSWNLELSLSLPHFALPFSLLHPSFYNLAIPPVCKVGKGE